MPHVFTSRPRKHALWCVNKENELRSHCTWELINVLIYEIGGIIFVIGSVFFLPKYEDLGYGDEGCWLFVGGSILYGVVSLHDLIEVLSYSDYDDDDDKNKDDSSPPAAAITENAITTDDDDDDNHNSKTKTTSTQDNNDNNNSKLIDACAAFCYLAGSIIFIIGSVLFLPNIAIYVPGAWCFIAGSGVFIGGAVLNSMQIFAASHKWIARFMNLTAVCYVIGSCFFLTGSVPYLWTFNDDNDAILIDKFAAYQFIVGSLFFTLGGFINGRRAQLVMNESKSSVIVVEKKN